MSLTWIVKPATIVDVANISMNKFGPVQGPALAMYKMIRERNEEPSGSMLEVPRKRRRTVPDRDASCHQSVMKKQMHAPEGTIEIASSLAASSSDYNIATSWQNLGRAAYLFVVAILVLAAVMLQISNERVDRKRKARNE